MNMNILISINRKVSRWGVGVSLRVLYAKRRGGVIYIYIVYNGYISYFRTI